MSSFIIVKYKSNDWLIDFLLWIILTITQKDIINKYFQLAGKCNQLFLSICYWKDLLVKLVLLEKIFFLWDYSVVHRPQNS